MTAAHEPAPRFLLLPGWLDSDPGHWQSRWERLHNCERVEQDDWRWPKRGDWMSRLEEVLLDTDRPAVLIAHSLGCQLVAAWAAYSVHPARVRAALLVAPPDTERDDMPPHLHTWRPIPRIRLPFPSALAFSTDDPHCTAQRAAGMASDWGSQAHDLGARGHLNTASALGDWTEGWGLVRRLLR